MLSYIFLTVLAFSYDVNLIGYYGNSGSCDASGCIPDFDEVHEAYNVIIVTFLNFDSTGELQFGCSQYAPVQLNNLKEKVASWKDLADPWGRNKYVLASIGGQNGYWGTYDDATVVEKFTDWLETYGIDGLDIDIESGSVLSLNNNINAFKTLKQNGFILSAAPEAAQATLDAYKTLLPILNWVHPQFYNNAPNAVIPPFVPEYEGYSSWQDLYTDDRPWWLCTMDTTAEYLGMEQNQKGVAVPASTSAAGSNNDWDMTKLATHLKSGDIQHVATWALGYDRLQGWALGKAIKTILDESETVLHLSSNRVPTVIIPTVIVGRFGQPHILCSGENCERQLKL